MTYHEKTHYSIMMGVDAAAELGYINMLNGTYLRLLDNTLFKVTERIVVDDLHWIVLHEIIKTEDKRNVIQ